MMRSSGQRRLSWWIPRALVVLGAALGLDAVVACQGSRLSSPDVIACTDKNPCPCEQDPTQNQCKGFNERGDTGTVPLFEGGPELDAGDAGETGPDDAGDASDASDDADA